ncbi:MAG TPA: DUF4386 domain-containing protein [Candidatus Eremiobacteraceae bacterium]|nr:DUF4386 domain-containing protein [Candidatus Eremiobacteraceae bacterium]
MTSTSTKARIAGLLYLLLAVFGPFLLIYVPNQLVADGNPAATASNIATHEMLLRFGIASDVVGGVLVLAVALALYWLFEPVDRFQAWLIVILGGILPCAIYFLNSLNWFAALVLVHGDSVAPAFAGPQRDDLVMLFMRLHHYGVVVSLVFAGLWLLPIGSLIIKSGYVPKFIGWWLILAGMSWLAQSIVPILLPQYSDIASTVGFPFGLGEIAFLLWLLVMGAKERASVAT